MSWSICLSNVAEWKYEVAENGNNQMKYMTSKLYFCAVNVLSYFAAL